MTTQEFVKKEKDRIVNELFHPATDYSETKLLAKQEFGNGLVTGLTKGLEIAKEFAEWLPTNRWRHTIVKATTKTTDELLTIFLTEKYGQ